MRNYFILSFIFFSIVLPLGIQPAIQAHYVFAQTDVDSIDDSIDEYGNAISSTTKIKEKDRIHSTPDNAYSIENIITQEDISNLKSSSASSSSSSSVQAQSANEVYGDFNGDGRDDIAIGTPDESLETGTGIFGAGAVNVLYSSSNGLSATTPRPDQFWTQDTADVNDVAEETDRFASALS